jgi:hypothetical protein
MKTRALVLLSFFLFSTGPGLAGEVGDAQTDKIHSLPPTRGTQRQDWQLLERRKEPERRIPPDLRKDPDLRQGEDRGAIEQHFKRPYDDNSD